MHFYLRLIQQYPFVFLFMGGGGVPPGFDRVITTRAFVVTGRGNQVIAKHY